MLYFTGFVLAEAQRVGSVMAALQWGVLILLPSHMLLAGIKFWWYRRALLKDVERGKVSVTLRVVTYQPAERPDISTIRCAPASLNPIGYGTGSNECISEPERGLSFTLGKVRARERERVR
jgi:hypothetical protein